MKNNNPFLQTKKKLSKDRVVFPKSVVLDHICLTVMLVWGKA